MQKLITYLSLFTFLLSFSLQAEEKKNSKVFHYYCTVADDRHYTMVINLIGSIHKRDFDHLDEIAVFDIGFTQEQVATLESFAKTKVYKVEEKHPDLCKYFQTNEAGRTVRGWYAWKPVVLKQALEKYPYFLYLDAGTLVLKSPDNLFKHIAQNGYYLMNIAPHSIESTSTKAVIERVISKFPKDQQEYLLKSDTPMIDAGFQGISKMIYENYVLPMYQHASDITLFEDDGSARLGFGQARYDQTLFSIYAHASKLNLNCQDWTHLKINNEDIAFHSHWNHHEVNNETVIYRSRVDYHYDGDQTPFIHKKNKPIVTSSSPKTWSILICTLQERSEQFSKLFDKLSNQVKENHLEDQIEILFFNDNREHTVGFKRNALVQRSQGQYLNFIDDDDDIHDNYIKMIYDKLQDKPDCVSLNGVITFNGNNPAAFVHSIQYKGYFQQDGVYYRPPNHLNTMKRSVASQFLFPDISHGEDTNWAMQIAQSGLLNSEATLDIPYYFYKYTDK